MTSEPTSPPVVPPLHSPKSPVWPTFPFHREGSRVWERGGVPSRDLPSPLPTKRTRTYSATARASAGPVFKGVCKQFSRSQGHGFITPENGSEDIFVHVSEPQVPETRLGGTSPLLGQSEQGHVAEAEVDQVLQQFLPQVVLDGLHKKHRALSVARVA
ncbi:PREDICTED: cold shock domain-containing protein C2 isoform X3 [Galeopterus variegatus]|uniref:Cold shock domain-containing protein C2 isoform X3 n=1 Tax=Galeopterus variegatus TaxID=482537 RepID=A0ABM0QVN7_GALVR|nr:PREDICTED: cold shock domain-containing protein C2 isoform X3 [Galeopterus variegatus]